MTSRLHDALRLALSKGPAVRIAILFGSTARGEARSDSDVDVAILPVRRDLSLAEEHELTVALERAAGAPVDLVRIDHASSALRWRIARDGVVLWSDPPHAASRFRAQAGIDHDEVRELAAEAAERFRARLATSSEERHR